MPKGAIVGAIFRENEIIIPRGDTMIMPVGTDSSYSHCQQVLPKLEKLLTRETGIFLMNFQIIVRFTGILVFFLGVAMAPPLGVSFLLKDNCTQPLFLAMVITCVSGIILFLLTRNQKEKHLNHRDGVAIVALGWMMAGLVGALPYLFSGVIPDFTNACFESISGFTTTGASIITDIESLPEGILLWRSLTQWLGGMGYYCAIHRHSPFLGHWRHAALQGRNPQPRGGQTETQNFGNRQDPLENLSSHNTAAGIAASCRAA